MSYFCTPCDKEHEDDEFGGSYCREYILYESEHDLIKFGQFFLPRDFLGKNKTPDFHHIIAKKLISKKPKSRVCNIVPRGFAKSTLVKAAILHKICFNPYDKVEFIAWVCETQKQAIKHLKYLREQIKYNDRIHEYFPHIKILETLGPKEKKRRKTKDTEDDFETTKGDKVVAVGMEQKMRGGVHTFEPVLGEPMELRYTIVVLDDFEGEHNTKTPESRQKNKDLLASSVLPAMEISPGWQNCVWMSGTIVHYDSFLQSVYDHWKQGETDETQQVWDLDFYRATSDGRLDDETSVPLWPDRFPLSSLREEKLAFESLGSPHKFPQEYMNDARDEASAPIKVSLIKTHNLKFVSQNGHAYLVEEEEDGYAIPVFVYLGVDPAWSTTSISDFSVIYAEAVDSERNEYELEIYKDRLRGIELLKPLMNIARQYAPINRVHIDPSGGGQNIIDEYKMMAKMERKLLPGVATPASYPKKIDKAERNTQALARPIHDGRWYMRPNDKPLLADELFELPFPKYDDVTDAAYLAHFFAQKRFPRSAKFPKGELGRHKTRSVRSHANWRSRQGWDWKTGKNI